MQKITFKDITYELDELLVKICKVLKKAVLQLDWDVMLVVDGLEGAGKSTLAQQIACFFDPEFDIEQVAFTPRQFQEAVLKAEKGQCIIFDEAFTGLSSRQTISITNKILVEMLMEVRQKNLFLIIVCPSFFELDRYCAIHRSRFLINVYTHKKAPFKRGFFRIFGQQKKKEIYLYGKKGYVYCRAADHHGKFDSVMPLGQVYFQKKYESLRAKIKRSADAFKLEKIKSREALKKLVWHLYSNDIMSIQQLCELTEYNKRTLYNLVKEYVQQNP